MTRNEKSIILRMYQHVETIVFLKLFSLSIEYLSFRILMKDLQ